MRFANRDNLYTRELTVLPCLTYFSQVSNRGIFKIPSGCLGMETNWSSHETSPCLAINYTPASRLPWSSLLCPDCGERRDTGQHVTRPRGKSRARFYHPNLSHRTFIHIRGSGVLRKGQRSWNIFLTKEARADPKVVLESSMECPSRGIFFCP